MSNLGITEIITNKKTRSNKKGQAIEFILALRGIIISQGGYLPFHNDPKSYHRLLWINISHKIAFGKNKAPYRDLAERRLILDHIRDQNKYMSNIRLLTREKIF